MRFFCSATISDKMKKTPEGFLVCQDVAITRVGELIYLPSEVPIKNKGSSGYVTVERTTDDVFDVETMQSFEGKPLTIGHPSEFVGPHNWKKLSVGTLHNVRQGTGDMLGKLVTDILITDEGAIKAVERKDNPLRQVSCGYDAEYIEMGPGRARQTQIRGNHLALVPRGRAGPECAIFDSAPEDTSMTMKQKLLAFFTKAVDAMPDDMEEEAEDGLNELVNPKLREIAAAKKAAEKAKIASDKAKDEAVAQAKEATDALAAMKATVDALTAEVAALKAPKQEPAKVTHDAATVAAAEILAPGIAKDSASLKVDALKAAYGTEAGKAAIHVLTGGKEPAYDSAAVVDVIFNASSALVADERKKALEKKTPKTPANDGQVQDFHVAFSEAAAKLHPIPKF